MNLEQLEALPPPAHNPDDYAKLPLKWKYLQRKASKAGKTKPRTGNTHGPRKPKGRQGDGHRRRSYNTHITL